MQQKRICNKDFKHIYIIQVEVFERQNIKINLIYGNLRILEKMLTFRMKKLLLIS